MSGPTDRELIIGEFDAAVYPSGSPCLTEAALGIYQVLLWYDPVAHVLHVNESNELQKPAWAKRARDGEAYLAERLGVPPAVLPRLVDRMMQLPRWQEPEGGPMQRNNPLGNGLRTLVAEVLTRFTQPSSLAYEEEVDATQCFPGIYMPGRSRTPKMDIMAGVGRRPRAIISCKWSIRHDRISDPTNECTTYKAAATMQQLPELGYYVVTNEFSVARLEKVLSQPCVDGLVHVHAPLLRAMVGGKADAVVEHSKFYDLVDFVELARTW
jgi:hypothetical protein